MNDLEIVQHVYTWNDPPQGMPINHRLYYKDRNGWWYLSRDGQRLQRQHNIKADREALESWARQAVKSVVKWLDD